MEFRFAHFGFHCRDVEAVADFYKAVLGFAETDRGQLGSRRLIFLSRDPREHHQLVLGSGLTAPPVEEVINQISLRADSLADLLALHGALQAYGVADLQPVSHGNAWSVYFRDPEGNRIEVYVGSPWYVAQPCRMPIDPALGAEAIFASTEAWCRAQPGFASADAYQQALAERISVAKAQSVAGRAGA